jgi:hypothetical protein
MRHDALAIHHLYLAATPEAVQVAEGLSSRYWDGLVDPAGSVARRGPARRLVVLENGALVAWALLLVARGGPHYVRMVVHPASPHVAPALLQYAVSALESERPRGVVCTVREHQASVLAALAAVQFEHVDTRLLLVKQLGVPLIERRLVPALQKI